MANETKRITKDQIAQQYSYMHQAAALLGETSRFAYVQTFGCQQNEADSELLSGMLIEMGYSLTEDPQVADLIIVNTCAIREHAELKALSITGQFKHLKEQKPGLIIAVCGCMVSQLHRKEDIKNKYPYVSILFGTSMLYRFPEILLTYLQSQRRVFYLDDSDGNIAEGLPIARKNPLQAWVSIMYGCNNFCTYCIVPYVRGRERSREPQDILKEVAELAKQGYKEITLLGQNVNSYGKDLSISYDFADLLSDVCAINGAFTVRFMTSHPKDATDKLIDAIADNPKVARQFHLPLQSGSDAVLKAMNRHYDRAQYLSFVERLRKRIPEIGLTTDIIVGFPGETEADFEDTLDILKRVRFDNIYSFLYSRRKGTPADKMESQIPEPIKKDRFARLLAVQNQISRERNMECVGQIVEVFVEGVSKTDSTKLTGRTAWSRLVHFAADPKKYVGQNAKVRVTAVETHAMYGELIEE